MTVTGPYFREPKKPNRTDPCWCVTVRTAERAETHAFETEADAQAFVSNQKETS
jgi:hypothetical protein